MFGFGNDEIQHETVFLTRSFTGDSFLLSNLKQIKPKLVDDDKSIRFDMSLHRNYVVLSNPLILALASIDAGIPP